MVIIDLVLHGGCTDKTVNCQTEFVVQIFSTNVNVGTDHVLVMQVSVCMRKAVAGLVTK